MTHGWVIIGIAILIAAVAAVTDARAGRIPNWLSLPPLVLAPCLYAVLGGPSAFAHSLLGAAAASFVPYLLFRSGAAGGGDVKVFAALGALCGIRFTIEAQLFAFTVASCVAVCFLFWRGALGHTLKNTLFLAVNPLLPRAKRRALSPDMMTPIRLGLPILVGVLLAVGVNQPFIRGLF